MLPPLLLDGGVPDADAGTEDGQRSGAGEEAVADAVIAAVRRRAN